MFEDILVATDRHDLAEEPIRHRSARERRFVDRLRGIALELVFPTDSTTYGVDSISEDLEIQTENASRHAIDLARVHQSTLHVLFTIDAVRYDTTVEFATEPLVEEGEESVERLVDAAEAAGLAATGEVEVGRPVELILGYVLEHDVDLIVLNARGPSGLRSRLRGRLLSTVIDRATVPVYAVPKDWTGYPD